jgi:hypothetical protein
VDNGMTQQKCKTFCSTGGDADNEDAAPHHYSWYLPDLTMFACTDVTRRVLRHHRWRHLPLRQQLQVDHLRHNPSRLCCDWGLWLGGGGHSESPCGPATGWWWLRGHGCLAVLQRQVQGPIPGKLHFSYMFDAQKSVLCKTFLVFSQGKSDCASAQPIEYTDRDGLQREWGDSDTTGSAFVTIRGKYSPTGPTMTMLMCTSPCTLPDRTGFTRKCL